MLITFAPNEGAGNVSDIDVPTNMSVHEFVRQYMPHFDSGRHQVRVNCNSCGLGDLLEEGDHLAVMPTKAGGGS